MPRPNTSVFAPTAESTEMASTENPAKSSSTRLLSRSSTGFGRLLRGIAHAVAIRFWMAWPSPSAPYSAATVPTTTALVEPRRPSGRPSCSPMIGKVLSAELSAASWRSGLPCRKKPKIDEASSSSGKIATNA